LKFWQSNRSRIQLGMMLNIRFSHSH